MLRVATMLAAVLLALAACFSKPGEPQVTGDGGVHDGTRQDGTRSDAREIDAARTIDAMPQQCVPTLIADFNGAGNGCPVGFLTAMTAGVTIGYNGTLNMTIANSSSGTGTCSSGSAFGFGGGATIEVTALPTSMGAQATFSLSVQNNSKMISFRASTPSSLLMCPDGTSSAKAFSLTAPFYIRLVGNGAPNEVLSVQLSSDGLGYQTFDTCPALTGSAGSATPTLSASGSGSQVTISFENLEACQ